MKKFFFWIAPLLVFPFVGSVMAVEEPKYSVLENAPPFELRAYAPMILAQVQVEGDLDEASSQGFRLIAAYIFGQNQVNEKVAMTAPVTMEGQSIKNQKIAMTAPVNIEKEGGSWTVSFVMPAQYTVDTLPKPLNPQVIIKSIPASKKAVITFSGFYDIDKVGQKTKALEEWISSKNLHSISAPTFARYNPPWTLPFMRRNEILIDVRD